MGEYNRRKLGRMTGPVNVRANNVLLHWLRHCRRRHWYLMGLSWVGRPDRPAYTREELAEIFHMKRIAHAAVNKPIAHVMNLDGLEAIPGIKDFLTSRYYGDPSDNDERMPGSIYICARDGEFGVTLKEPTQAFMLKMSVPSFKLLIPTIEATLADPHHSLWETDPYARKPNKKKARP